MELDEAFLRWEILDSKAGALSAPSEQRELKR
jgi:hypothetical protein